MKRRTERASLRLRLVLGLVTVALLVVPGFAPAAPSSTLLEFWDASDETNTATIDHSAWQDLLTANPSSHPSGVNRFDYAALKAKLILLLAARFDRSCFASWTAKGPRLRTYK